MRSRARDIFATVHVQGAILPPDILKRVADGDRALPGIDAESYHLHAGERQNEVTSRSWQRLQGAWLAFQTAREALPEGDRGTTITRERWLLVLFQELGYGRLQTAKALEIEGKTYAISHLWQHVPFDLVGCNVPIDKREAGVAGAARMNPHGLMQELLNRSDDHLWGFVSNGLELRLLRDNISLSRQAYIEFDLEAMMEGEVYADFRLLWLLCHESRLEGERPEDCLLEKWSQVAQESGIRALNELRVGVEDAIKALGNGFLAHPENRTLRESLYSGEFDAQEYYRELLRLVYRLLFLFTAEDRDLLLLPVGSVDDPEAGARIAARVRYTEYFSTARLRDMAVRYAGRRHDDLMRSLALVMEALASDEGRSEIALPPLASYLFSRSAVATLADCALHNTDLLGAVRALAFTRDGHALRPIDFGNLGSEELGSVYEALLELRPEINLDGPSFELSTVAGNERKTTGSYYTPSSLIECLLDSALEPVVAETLKGKRTAEEKDEAILGLRVCDPACGSGHFLIGAARRLARHLAAARSGDDEPAPTAVRDALRDVIGHCIYGVDINAMSVELCKVNLWMEALEPGKPLSFLDHRIQCGNSLLGATPALLHEGILDDAFKPIEGDDQKVCTELRKQNKRERAGQTSLFGRTHEPWQRLSGLAAEMTDLESVDDGTPGGVHEKQACYESLVRSGDYLYGKLLADAWCAAFVWPKAPDTAYQVTEEVFRKMEDDPQSVPVWLPEQIQRLAGRYSFFHWHVRFPDVFRIPATGQIATNEPMGWDGGFDVVLGNPPWERVKLQEKEWFAAHGRDDIATAPNAAARKKMIEALTESDDPADRQLHAAFKADIRQAEGESELLRSSARYPLCGRGDVNTYAVFAELKRSLLSPRGRVGCIVPSGIATDDTTKFFFGDLVDKQKLASLLSFENEEFIFPAVHHATKFCLLTMVGRAISVDSADFVFFARQVAGLKEDERHFALTAEDIALLNPNTRTCPIFRSKRDAEITKAIYRRVPVLMRDGTPPQNPWGIKFTAMFHMANNSDLFRTRPQLEGEGWTMDGNVFRRGDRAYLPLYEGKMIHQFDHRYGTYEGQTQAQANQGTLPRPTTDEKSDRRYCVVPRYWVPTHELEKRLSGKWSEPWLLVCRRFSRNTDERSAIFSLLPRVAAGDNIFALCPTVGGAHRGLWLLANLNAFVFDYCVRQKVGGTNLNFYLLEQLPVLRPDAYSIPCPWSVGESLGQWVITRASRLAFTADDVGASTQEVGGIGMPVAWDEESRFQLRCELDAAFFHLYSVGRHDVGHILDSFWVVRDQDEKRFGEYRTKSAILSAYDRMARS